MKELFYLWIILANLWGLAMMFIDKRRAFKHHYRIPEKTFYVTAFLGGVFSIELGMILFHHKTKKAKFYWLIHLALVVWIVLLFICHR